jgi:endo-1,4-beta-xylanase
MSVCKSIRRLTAVLAGVLCMSAAPATAQTQIVSHNFDDGTVQGWIPRGGVTLTASTDVARSGTHSLKTTGRTQGFHGPSLSVTSLLAPNASYQITGWVRLVAGQPASNLKFTVQRTTGGTNFFNQVNTAVNTTDAAWVQLQGTYSFAEAGSALLLYLESDDPTSAYYLDDFTIVQLSGGCPEPLDQSGFTTDFEDGTNQGWGPRGPAVLTNVTEDAQSGSRSLRVTGRLDTWQGPTRNVQCKLHNGSRYLISVWAKLLPGEPATQLRVSFERRLAGNTTFHTVIGNTTVSDTTWVNLRTEYQYAFDSDALQLYVESASDPDVSFYIDDVELRFLPAKPIQDLPPLHEQFTDAFGLGAAMEPFQTSGPHAELALRHFNSITAENSMKFGPLHPAENTFNFTGADTLANFARTNGLRMRGHALLWHQQNPAWLFQDFNGQPLQPGNDAHRTLLIQRLENHIQTVVTRYADIVDSWDVVNEVIDPNAPGGLRETPWLEIVGPEYIDMAFEFARAADPDAKLYINDFSTTDPAKRTALRNVVQGLLDRGVPVDGVGHQMHINVLNPPLANIRATLEVFGAMGLDNQVTEMDVSGYTNSTSTAPLSEGTLVLQGYRYRDVFRVYRELKDIISSVTMWGLADDTTWLKNFPVARPDKPLFFDEELQAKYAYWGVVDTSMLPVIIKQLNVSGGAAQVDGQSDARWNVQSAVRLQADGVPAWASFKALWSANTLYLLVDVLDSSKNAGDSVEVFVDENNDKTTSYGADDRRYLFQGSGKLKNGPEAIIIPIQGGYRLEAAIPITRTLDEGDQVGFDIRVTDAAGAGERLSWSDTTHEQDDDTSRFGILRLTDPLHVATAIQGTPVIDAVAENAWKQANEITTETVVLGNSGATAVVKTLWDEGHLYVFATVTDPLLSTASNNPWEEDSIEIFVDQNNAKTVGYEADDAQYRVNFENTQSFGGSASASKFVTATRLTDDGYVVEASIELDAIQAQAGMLIGFDFQVNDDGLGNGVRSSVKTWNDPVGTAFEDTSQFGVLQLVVAGQGGRP